MWIWNRVLSYSFQGQIFNSKCNAIFPVLLSDSKVWGLLSPELRLLVTTGFLGGLTTFSTFSAESVTLISRGEYGWASLHLLGHVFGSLLMTGLGLLTVHFLKS